MSVVTRTDWASAARGKSPTINTSVRSPDARHNKFDFIASPPGLALERAGILSSGTV
jgi:hypothetical protein